MTATFTVEQLEKSLAMLRRQGVKSYTDVAGGGFTVEFFPEVATEEPAKPSNDPEMCACKHHLIIAHVNGLCVEGCTEAECAGGQKA